MEFEKLAKRLAPKLKGIAYRLNHRFTFFNDEDLFQEALIHLWQEFMTGKLADKTDSYILQGCYFYLQNYIRTVKDKYFSLSLDKCFSDEDDNSVEFLALKDEKSQDFLEHLNRKLLVEVIQNNGLTIREKELLPFFAEGLPVREIGKRIGVSHVWVLKMRDEIRAKCRKHLEMI